MASCRTVAGSLRCPRGTGEPCGRPVVAAFGQARPRGRRGIGFRASSALRPPEGRSGSRSARMSPRRRPPSPPVRFVSHALAASARAGAAYGCPGSGVGAPVPLMRTRTGRSNVAARGGAGLVAGRIIAESGGVWQRQRGGAGENCANGGSARPRYVGRCGAPSHSGGARHCRRVGVDGRLGDVVWPFRRTRSAPVRASGARSGASDRDPNGPRPLAGLGSAKPTRARAEGGGQIASKGWSASFVRRPSAGGRSWQPRSKPVASGGLVARKLGRSRGMRTICIADSLPMGVRPCFRVCVRREEHESRRRRSTGKSRRPTVAVTGDRGHGSDGWRWDMTGIWAGADPGGIGAFGVASTRRVRDDPAAQRFRR